VNTWRNFRLPIRALRRHYLWGVGALLVGCIVPALRGQGSQIDLVLLIFLVLVILIATAATYLLSKMRVWVALSEQGVRGRGAFGRHHILPWSERVSVLNQPGEGIFGVRYGRVDQDGLPTMSGAIFIPYAILMSPEFQNAVAELAPANHPLRARGRNTT
jgi:hypothetical protein